jgi:hypothetical protein
MLEMGKHYAALLGYNAHCCPDETLRERYYLDFILSLFVQEKRME